MSPSVGACPELAQLRLFPESAPAVRPALRGRLKHLARRVERRGSLLSSVARDDERAMARLRDWGDDLAERFGLPLRALEPERAGVHGHYGICYQDGLIRIRLRHAKTGRLLKESSLVDTLCHELAHLRHFDHSSRFRRFYARILAEARRLGYYRPGRAGGPSGLQLALFDPAGCATARAEPRGGIPADARRPRRG